MPLQSPQSLLDRQILVPLWYLLSCPPTVRTRVCMAPPPTRVDCAPLPALPRKCWAVTSRPGKWAGVLLNAPCCPGRPWATIPAVPQGNRGPAHKPAHALGPTENDKVPPCPFPYKGWSRGLTNTISHHQQVLQAQRVRSPQLPGHHEEMGNFTEAFERALYAFHTSLEPGTILLPLPPQRWDDRHAPPKGMQNSPKPKF